MFYYIIYVGVDFVFGSNSWLFLGVLFLLVYIFYFVYFLFICIVIYFMIRGVCYCFLIYKEFFVIYSVY